MSTMFRTVFLTLLLTAGCSTEIPGEGGPNDDTDDTQQTTEEEGVQIPIGPLGFVGSPCESVADCPFTDAVCLSPSEGFPDGMCSVGCDQFCPDLDAHPTTFCVEDRALPADAPVLGDGACAARCDFEFFPTTGCRADYGCVAERRANETGTSKFVCMPNAETDLSECYFELAAMGVSFEPTLIADDSPSSHPSLTCHVQDPVRVKSPVYGVDLLYSNGNTPSAVTGSCEFAKSLALTAADVEAEGAVALRHLGTYNCRVISGTNRLSRHAYGDAIDISGFDFADGETYTLYDDWQHGTSNPDGAAAEFLYDAAYRWFGQNYWEIILTPNYNSAHDDHFHVDLTPNGDYIRSDTRYIGPAPYSD